MIHDLIVPVGDLLGHPGKQRPFSGEMNVDLRLGDTTVRGPMIVSGIAHGLLDAIRVEFTAAAEAHLTCTRCLAEWEETMEVASEQFFGVIPDEDGYAIVDASVDVSGPAQDELALALPAVPLCREDCLGLCPTCGTDLNRAPCDGHGDDADSPFAVLKDLFDS